jgi:inorganic phosphate transporter, PiT family
MVGRIAMSWVISPVIAGVLAWLLFTSVQRLILDRDNPLKFARRYVPFYMFLAGFFMTWVTVDKGLAHVGLEFTTLQANLLAISIGLVITAIGTLFMLRIPYQEPEKREFHFVTVERIFGILMVITACCMAFAHGSNDVANAVGPAAAVVSVAASGSVTQEAIVPIWILVLGGIGIVIGLATYGHRVIATVGQNITALTPSRGFAAGLAAAATIVMASGTGLPISTTHTVVGAILGVGMARGIAAINLRVVGSIFMSWIITVPAGAALSVVFFLIFRATLG